MSAKPTPKIIRALPERLSETRRNDAYAAGYWREELVTDLLAAHAENHPDRLAVVDSVHRLTWGELNRLSRRFALHLREQGFGRGDAIALQLPNWAEYLVCYFGIQLAGAVVVQPGSDWREVETAYALGFGPARAAIIPSTFQDFDYQSMFEGLRSTRTALRSVFVARGEPRGDALSLDALLRDPIEERVDGGSLDAARHGPDDVVRLVFTSGTTGLPKAIMHTNNTVAHSSRSLAATFGHDEGDVCLQYVPLSTNYGAIMGLHLPVTARMPVVLMDRFSARGALRLIEEEGVSFLPGTPTGFIALTNAEPETPRDSSSLRLLMSAGSSFPVPAIHALRKRFGEIFVESYGMNEFGMGFWCELDDDPDEVDGSIGRPIRGLTARVVGADGASLPAGETGELAIQSAGMCCGYHDNDQANAASWDSDGWFYSGYLACVDDRGNFRIVGRSKDVIIRGGANVSPREVEEALSSHPAVREVAVVGLPDAYYGEIVCACVIPVPDMSLSSDEARSFLGAKLARFKLPERVVVLPAFPRNSMGKVQKAALIEQVQGQL